MGWLSPTGTSLTQGSFPRWDEYLGLRTFAAWAVEGFYPISPDPVLPEVASDDLDQVVRPMSPLYPATVFEEGFTVCDPASRTPEQGADVQFPNCPSFGHEKRLFEVEQIIVVQPAPGTP